LKDRGHDVEVFERKDRIGGMAYDEWIDGILVHSCGPHIVHTNDEVVWNFLSRYSKFRSFDHTVMAKTDVGFFPIPFSRKSVEMVGNFTYDDVCRAVFVDYSEKQ